MSRFRYGRLKDFSFHCIREYCVFNTKGVSHKKYRNVRGRLQINLRTAGHGCFYIAALLERDKNDGPQKYIFRWIVQYERSFVDEAIPACHRHQLSALRGLLPADALDHELCHARLESGRE